MNLFATAILIFLLSGITAQTNLVYNPGFEDGIREPNGVREVKQGYLLPYWYSPLKNRSPHYYVTPERSVAKAKSGTGAVGLVLGGYRQNKTKVEYLTGELKEPLKKDQAYCVCFNALLHRTSRWAAKDIGIRFHHQQDFISSVSDPQAQRASLYLNDGEAIWDTKWKQFCGYYVASGGEKHISIGKFGKNYSERVSDLNAEAYFELDAFQGKAYYQFDDFSVKAVNDSTDCHCATKIPSLEHDSIPAKIQPYLFALDVSGSMKKEGVYDSLRNHLKDLLEKLPIGTPVSFTTFSSEAKLLYKGIVEKNTGQQADSLLAKTKLGGGTNVTNGLSTAYSSRKVEKPDSAKIVLISDGSFIVSNRIHDLVKHNYETLERRLTIIQIEREVKGLEKLEPYEVSYVATSPSELSQAVHNLYALEGSSASAIGCRCSEIFSDTMNYHFVVDFSGSMQQEKDRAIKSLKYLLERMPQDAVISVTTFSNTAKEVYVGKKSETTLDHLSRILEAKNTGGGTNPTPGVKMAMNTAQMMSENRFSHLILITDLKASNLNGIAEMQSALSMGKDLYVAISAMTVDRNGALVSHTQYDYFAPAFTNVSKEKFETDLFYTKRSSCDFTSQPYHFNPVADALKKEAKSLFKEVLENGIKVNL